MDKVFFVGKYWMVFLDMRLIHKDIGLIFTRIFSFTSLGYSVYFSRISSSYMGIG